MNASTVRRLAELTDLDRHELALTIRGALRRGRFQLTVGCMDATAYNSLATARRLREAGFDQKQAETIADELRGAVTADRDTLATKADIEAAIASLEARLYRAMWIQGAGIVAIVGGFIAIAAALNLLA